MVLLAKGAPSAGEFQEVEGESEERRRARFERQQRTQERTVCVIYPKMFLISLWLFPKKALEKAIRASAIVHYAIVVHCL